MSLFIFTKNIKAYNYLLDSTKEFPHEKEFKKNLGSVGFKNIASKKKILWNFNNLYSNKIELNLKPVFNSILFEENL